MTRLTRRRFLLGSAALLAGCATNPVSGRAQLMLVTEEEERRVDRRQAPMQFSADYGPVFDTALADYVADIGMKIAHVSHRRRLPYSFTVVDAFYVNGYTFPAGSVGVTRGALLELTSEAELAALLGHEVGHVNARHAAARMSADKVAQVVVERAADLLAMIAPGVDDLTDMAYGLGGLGASLLLAKYSRDDEREADRLGMAYMVRAGYPASGMVDLLRLLQETGDAHPDLLATMFATHPMSRERFAVARRRAAGYDDGDRPKGRERYMDLTTPLRRHRGAIVEGGRGEAALKGGRFDEADRHFAIALKRAPEDYPTHLLVARLRLAQKRPKEAIPSVEAAMAIKPGEPQSWQVRGLCRFAAEEYEGAREDFARREEALPGDGSSIFMQAICWERMGKKKEAAQHYRRYLAYDATSRLAEYAYDRLEE